MKVKNAFIVVLLSVFCMTSCNDEKFECTLQIYTPHFYVI